MITKNIRVSVEAHEELRKRAYEGKESIKRVVEHLIFTRHET